MSYYSSPFTLIKSLSQVPFGSNVVIVSDTQYKEYRQSEAKREIEILEARAKSYRKTAELIDEEIAQIKKQVDLPEPLQMQQELPN